MCDDSRSRRRGVSRARHVELPAELVPLLDANVVQVVKLLPRGGLIRRLRSNQTQPGH